MGLGLALTGLAFSQDFKVENSTHLKVITSTRLLVSGKLPQMKVGWGYLELSQHAQNS